MTNTPTQAQIEAAAQVLYARESNDDAIKWHHLSDNWKKGLRLDAAAALTAAAEVGEQKDLADYRRECEALINRTIERCAQVADEYAEKVFDDPVCRTVAAAIRALKDKP